MNRPRHMVMTNGASGNRRCTLFKIGASSLVESALICVAGALTIGIRSASLTLDVIVGRALCTGDVQFGPETNVRAELIREFRTYGVYCVQDTPVPGIPAVTRVPCDPIV
jgi:hypothetical protein